MGLTDRNKETLYWIILISGFVLGLFCIFTQKFEFDQHQLYVKGNLLAAYGIWTHFGNPSSGGMGNVPGSLTAVLFGGPMTLWYSVYSPLIFIAFVHLCAYVLMDHMLKDQYGIEERLIFAVIYWLNPWRVMETVAWNPTYLFFCASLHLYSAYALREKPNGVMTLLHVLSIGMAFQIHNSSIILAVITIFLILFKGTRIHWTWFFVAVGMIAVSLIPYVIAVIGTPQLSPIVREQDSFIGRGLVYVYPLIKGILYWFRYGSLYFPGTIFREIGFQWISYEWVRVWVEYVWIVVKWAFVIPTLVISFLASLKLFKILKPSIKRRDFEDLDGKTWLLGYSVTAFATLVLVSCLTPVTYSYWHLLIVFPASLLPLFYFVVGCLKRQRKRTITGLIVVSVYFVLVNVFASIESERHSYKYDQQAQFQTWLDQGKLGST